MNAPHLATAAPDHPAAVTVLPASHLKIIELELLQQSTPHTDPRYGLGARSGTRCATTITRDGNDMGVTPCTARSSHWLLAAVERSNSGQRRIREGSDGFADMPGVYYLIPPHRGW